MTTKEIIEKGEELLLYTLNQLLRGNSKTVKKDLASRGIDQLEMLSYILNEEYENYDYWFNEFYKYI